jgi:hypothetical protein
MGVGVEEEEDYDNFFWGGWGGRWRNIWGP